MAYGQNGKIFEIRKQDAGQSRVTAAQLAVVEAARRQGRVQAGGLTVLGPVGRQLVLLFAVLNPHHGLICSAKAAGWGASTSNGFCAGKKVGPCHGTGPCGGRQKTQKFLCNSLGLDLLAISALLRKGRTRGAFYPVAADGQDVYTSVARQGRAI